MPAKPEAEIPPEEAAQRLDPRSVTVGRLAGWAFVLVVTVFALAALIVSRGPGNWLAAVGGLAVIASLGFLAQIAPTWRYRHTWYRVDTNGIEIGRGRFWQRVITVPHARVQHIDVVRGPIERRFGLATLVIFTAGNVHSDIKVEGLSQEAALALRERLVKEKGLDAV